MNEERIAKMHAAKQAKATAAEAQELARCRRLRPLLSDEHRRQIDYINRQLAGDREPGDQRILRERREDIMRRVG